MAKSISGANKSTKQTADESLPVIQSRVAEMLVTEMMAIPGRSGNEGAIVDFIRQRLKKAGIPNSAISTDSAHKKSRAVNGEVGNLIVKLPGTMRKPRRLMMAHIDTVPLCVGAKPVRRGKLIVSADATTALGGDDRAGAAVLLNAILEIQRQQLPHPPLTLFWPVQEEIGLCGARYVTKSKLGNPKLCFNWDGGDPATATIGATGDDAIHIEIDGIASHAGGAPECGVSAISIASMAIADLTQNGWHGAISKGRNTGTSNVGMIHGGDATNVVTPHLSLKAEVRSHNPKFRARIVNEFRKAFNRAVKAIKNIDGQRGTVHFNAALKYEAFAISPNDPCVKTAVSAISSVGLTADTKISNGGLDANWMFQHGFPTVTLGCGQDAIHTVNERLHIDSYLQACRIGLAIATGAE